MNKKYFFLSIIGIIIIITISFLFIQNRNHIWDVNADKLKNSIISLNNNESIKDLSEFTPFKWDTLYSFAPYTPSDSIYKVVGYKWDSISETVSENMNQIVFVKDGKVVCYLYGYPEHLKLYFNFGKYKGSYTKLTSDQKIQFNTMKSTNGITFIDLIK